GAGGAGRGGGGGARGVVRVVVPAERVEAFGQAAEDRILGGRRRQLDGEPTDLRAVWNRVDRRAVGLGDQLDAETDAQQRDLAVEQAADELVLVTKPGVMLVL